MPSVEYKPPRSEITNGVTLWTPGFDRYGKYWYVYFYYQKWTSAFGEQGQVRYYYRCSKGGEITTQGRINQDAIKTGNNLGIPEDSAMTFNQENVYNAFEGLSCAIGRQVSGENETVQFSGLERMASQPSPSSPIGCETFTVLGRY